MKAGAERLKSNHFPDVSQSRRLRTVAFGNQTGDGWCPRALSDLAYERRERRSQRRRARSKVAGAHKAVRGECVQGNPFSNSPHPARGRFPTVETSPFQLKPPSRASLLASCLPRHTFLAPPSPPLLRPTDAPQQRPTLPSGLRRSHSHSLPADDDPRS